MSSKLLPKDDHLNLIAVARAIPHPVSSLFTSRWGIHMGPSPRDYS